LHPQERCGGLTDIASSRVSAALKSALKDPDLVKRFNDISTEPMLEDRGTPEAAQRTLASEIDRWAPIIRAAGEYAD
jgi:putative tricarboxylic transport membrane protein